MKTILVVLFALPVLAIAAWAGGTIREADYPTQYQVVDTSQNGKLPVKKSCSMTLRDPAKPNVDINVWKRGVVSCKPLDSGKSYRGRLNEKKNQIELIIPLSDNKARVDVWDISGTVSNPSNAAKP